MPVTDISHDLDALTLTITAQFAAPVQRIWDIYADPRQLEKVWGPPEYPATVVDHDPRPRRSRHLLHDRAGGRALLRVLERARRLRNPPRSATRTASQTRASPRTPDLPVSTCVSTFTEQDGATQAVYVTSYASREGLQTVLDMERRGGFAHLDQPDRRTRRLIASSHGAAASRRRAARDANVCSATHFWAPRAIGSSVAASAPPADGATLLSDPRRPSRSPMTLQDQSAREPLLEGSDRTDDSALDTTGPGDAAPDDSVLDDPVLDDTVLDNPAWSSLTGHHAQLAIGNDLVKHFPDDVSPFVGVKDWEHPEVWEAVLDVFGHGATVGVSHADPVLPEGWEQVFSIPGVQLTQTDRLRARPDPEALELGAADSASTCSPSSNAPSRARSSPRTHELGRYIGIRRERATGRDGR